MRTGIFATSIAVVALGVSCSTNALAQARANFIVDELANCQQPLVRDFPVHIEGTGTLSTDGSARVDLSSNVEGYVSYRGRLGRESAAPGGSASLRVTSRRSLRATREYPNNYILVDLKVIGNSCSIRVENRLKPGKRQYTFSIVGGGIAYCEKPRIVKTSCAGL